MYKVELLSGAATERSEENTTCRDKGIKKGL